MIRRVVKVGGSLLKRTDLACQIRLWLDQQSVAENLFLFGGGEVINSVRKLDRIHSLEPAMAHWMCVELMSASFAIANSWFSDWRTIQTRNQFDRLLKQRPMASNCLVKCSSFYHRDQMGNLPQNWQTTSDSIAAWLAKLTKSSELVLLKSCPVEPGLSYAEMAELKIIDDAFPTAVQSIESVRVESIGSG
jgi:aspartokinase-like uncharacterized kinase